MAVRRALRHRQPVRQADKQYEIRNGVGVGVGVGVGEPVWGARRGVFVGVSKTF
jgi:hypothetical protein